MAVYQTSDTRFPQVALSEEAVSMIPCVVHYMGNFGSQLKSVRYLLLGVDPEAKTADITRLAIRSYPCPQCRQVDMALYRDNPEPGKSLLECRGCGHAVDVVNNP